MILIDTSAWVEFLRDTGSIGTHTGHALHCNSAGEWAEWASDVPQLMLDVSCMGSPLGYLPSVRPAILTQKEETMPRTQVIPVLRLKQWLDAWNAYDFDPNKQRRRPEPYIYLFSMPATRLRSFSDVYRRERSVDYAEGIQRVREDDRTDRIRRYIETGYPFGDLRQTLQPHNLHLRKPGWLPTAIVVNVLTSSDRRRGKTIAKDHLACLVEHDGNHHLRLPDRDDFADSDLRPLEVIDGQHRLWAFDNDHALSDFEVPVVAFHGLDVAWQAYLFWSINITPKRINPSHAFDLYPLLRTQDWLEKTGEITVYREARAQEITEWLYRLPVSPWHNRISMLQRKGEARVSQAAWVRSLIGSFFGTGRGRGRYGLFQSDYDDDGTSLHWERVQQIAFLLEFWILLKKCVDEGEHDWIEMYRDEDKDAFIDKSSILNQDMGVRVVHAVLNDIFFCRVKEWGLDEWYFGIKDKTSTNEQDIMSATGSLQETWIHRYLNNAAVAMAGFDWRGLDGPNVRLSKDEIEKRAYRGSGGYTVLTSNLLVRISEHAPRMIADAATSLLPESQ